jgi:hypothetical protein
MTRSLFYQPPSPDDEAAWRAEQMWLLAEKRLNRKINFTGLGCAACLIVVAIAVTKGIPWLPGICAVLVFGCFARVVHLFVVRHHTFMAIKTAGGMSRQDALLELNQRYGG